MFKSARIKLTAWYIAIIMFITISFSTIVFMGVERNTRKALESQRIRIEHSGFYGGPLRVTRGPMLDAETLIDIRNRTLNNIVMINTLIVVISGALAYFLAGRTLKPIEEMMEKQKRFVSDAAHEIKTPLTAMKAELEVALRDKNLSVDESRKTLKSTIEEVDQLHKLTNKLLEKSRYQHSSTAHKDVELDKLIQKVVKNLTPIAKEKRESINLFTEPVKVRGDYDELEKVFVNLVENSIKYNKLEESINVSLNKIDGYAVVTVEDFGKGISEEDITNIFEPFFRADKSRTSSKSEGYGLGLTISKEIVEKHEGTISVESKLNEYTKFTVKIPLSTVSATGYNI
jgi:signal transduction histidine kinase